MDELEPEPNPSKGLAVAMLGITDFALCSQSMDLLLFEFEFLKEMYSNAMQNRMGLSLMEGLLLK